jgi:hypothetical protein
MRNFLIVLVVLIAAAIGYAWYRDPVGCQKIVGDLSTITTTGKASLQKDLKDLFTTVMSGAPPPAPAVVPQPASASSTPAPATPTAPPVAPPPKPAVVFARPQQWVGPADLPAQPNWTWTTLEGTTYQNVVVTKLGPDVVSISHAMGVAHDLPIADLPPDLQKQLNYDTAAASVARKERRREEEHPYYHMAQQAEAQALADQMHWPLAWLSAYEKDVAPDASASTDEVALSMTALKFLKDKTIVILINPDKEMPLTPPIVHHQFSKFDDGTLPGGANYLVPKVVFSTPDATTILGRVSYTQMKISGETALNGVYDSFDFEAAQPPFTPATNAAPSAPAPPAPAQVATPAPVTAPATAPAPTTQ